MDGFRAQVGGPYTKYSEMGSDIHGGAGVIGFWDPCMMFIFDIGFVDIYVPSYEGEEAKPNPVPT